MEYRGVSTVVCFSTSEVVLAVSICSKSHTVLAMLHRPSQNSLAKDILLGIHTHLRQCVDQQSQITNNHRVLQCHTATDLSASIAPHLQRVEEHGVTVLNYWPVGKHECPLPAHHRLQQSRRSWGIFCSISYAYCCYRYESGICTPSMHHDETVLPMPISPHAEWPSISGSVVEKIDFRFPTNRANFGLWFSSQLRNSSPFSVGLLSVPGICLL